MEYSPNANRPGLSGSGQGGNRHRGVMRSVACRGNGLAFLIDDRGVFHIAGGCVNVSVRRLGRTLLAGRRDVLCAGISEGFFGSGDLLGSIAVYGKKCAAILDRPLETLGLILRDSHADERADDAANRAADTETRERTHDGAGRDQRPNAGNGKRANAGQEAERPSDDTASGDAGYSAFRRLGVLLVRKGAGAFVVL